jgi:hypothetical protein
MDLAVAHYIIDAPVGVLLNTCGAAVPPALTQARQASPAVAPDEKTISLRAAPNPFSARTTIRFSVQKTGAARLGALQYESARGGAPVRGAGEAGRAYEVPFESKGFPPGVYVLRLATGDAVTAYRVVLIR